VSSENAGADTRHALCNATLMHLPLMHLSLLHTPLIITVLITTVLLKIFLVPSPSPAATSRHASVGSPPTMVPCV